MRMARIAYGVKAGTFIPKANGDHRRMSTASVLVSSIPVLPSRLATGSRLAPQRLTGSPVGPS